MDEGEVQKKNEKEEGKVRKIPMGPTCGTAACRHDCDFGRHDCDFGRHDCDFGRHD